MIIGELDDEVSNLCDVDMNSLLKILDNYSSQEENSQPARQRMAKKTEKPFRDDVDEDWDVGRREECYDFRAEERGDRGEDSDESTIDSGLASMNLDPEKHDDVEHGPFGGEGAQNDSDSDVGGDFMHECNTDLYWDEDEDEEDEEDEKEGEEVLSAIEVIGRRVSKPPIRLINQIQEQGKAKEKAKDDEEDEKVATHVPYDDCLNVYIEETIPVARVKKIQRLIEKIARLLYSRGQTEAQLLREWMLECTFPPDVSQHLRFLIVRPELTNQKPMWYTLRDAVAEVGDESEEDSENEE